ncbi:hypothetical protein HAX54_048743 [Datura stramonium]|uniref:Chorein N-terminal domain-containing protein n=1 Tax=Datura stramonium TaxID=4076 RepID=A0ABS8RTX4_DATST|nr:hypothetical protein [Datura stramonium]
MFEGLVRQLILGYLGRYIKDIQKEQLKITLWNEEVLLEDVELILEAFDYLQLPFALKQGRVGKLSIKIPWKKLGWDPVIISLEDVLVCASQRDDKEPPMATTASGQPPMEVVPPFPPLPQLTHPNPPPEQPIGPTYAGFLKPILTTVQQPVSMNPMTYNNSEPHVIWKSLEVKQLIILQNLQYAVLALEESEKTTEVIADKGKDGHEIQKEGDNSNKKRKGTLMEEEKQINSNAKTIENQEPTKEDKHNNNDIIPEETMEHNNLVEWKSMKLTKGEKMIWKKH